MSFIDIFTRLVILVTPILFIQEYFLPRLLKKMRNNVNQAVREKIKKIPKPEADKIKERFGSELYTEYRTRKLGYFSQIIGYSEIIFFGGLIVILISNEMTLIKGGDYFFKVFGGWLAVKTVSNYDQWSHIIAGKAYFYITIFGTLINIGFAVLMGVFFHGLFIAI